MRDIKELSNDYVRRSETVNKRQLSNFEKYLVRDFANYLIYNLNKPKNPYTNWKPTVENPKQKIALITEDVGHLTGGRYYCWFIASALMEVGFDVTVYTNQIPVFAGDFSEYQKPKIEVVCQTAQELETYDIEADIYLGSPISGNIAATRLGKKYNRPSYNLIFDPFPLMQQYLGKHEYIGWRPLIKEMRDSNVNIISLCHTTSEYIYEWLNKRPSQVFEVYPCINSKEKAKAEPRNKEDYVVFISRLVKHKNFEHTLKAVKDSGVKLKVISSVDGIGARSLASRMKMRDQVEFLMKITDKEKFEVIQGSKGVINSSGFEGFGMWAIEAIACGVPLICYDYPTIREIRDYAKADNFYLAEYMNESDLKTQLQKALKENKQREQSHLFDFESMINRVKKVFEKEVKIGVVTICLNEQKFIGASLQSVIKNTNVHKVAVVEGAVNLYPSATEEGLSVDNTADEIRKIKSNKIIYDRYGWARDKSELRNRALELLGNEVTHILVVDADEVWKQEDLDKLAEYMKQNPTKGVFLFPFYHFWKRKDLVAVGGQWESKMFRCFKFTDKTLRWESHELPVLNANKQYINRTDGVMELDDVRVYHYGYMKDEKDVQDKLLYYKKRDTYLSVTDTWTNWKEGMPTQPTHGEGTTAKFTGTHPEEVEGII